jgi:hypothetical protein
MSFASASPIVKIRIQIEVFSGASLAENAVEDGRCRQPGS